MRETLQRAAGPIARAIVGVAVFCVAGAAQARVEQLVWEHPTPGEVAGFKVHYGTAPGSYAQVVDIGRPAQAADGSFSYDLSVADDATVYVAVSAYATDGRASPVSNERLRAPDTSTGSGPPAPPILLPD